jgi:hypothetical protein
MPIGLRGQPPVSRLKYGDVLRVTNTRSGTSLAVFVVHDPDAEDMVSVMDLSPEMLDDETEPRQIHRSNIRPGQNGYYQKVRSSRMARYAP